MISYNKTSSKKENIYKKKYIKFVTNFYKWVVDKSPNFTLIFIDSCDRDNFLLEIISFIQMIKAKELKFHPYHKNVIATDSKMRKDIDDTINIWDELLLSE